MGSCPQVLLVPGAWSWLGGSHHGRWAVELWTNAAEERGWGGFKCIVLLRRCF